MCSVSSFHYLPVRLPAYPAETENHYRFGRAGSATSSSSSLTRATHMCKARWLANAAEQPMLASRRNISNPPSRNTLTKDNKAAWLKQTIQEERSLQLSPPDQYEWLIGQQGSNVVALTILELQAYVPTASRTCHVGQIALKHSWPSWASRSARTQRADMTGATMSLSLWKCLHNVFLQPDPIDPRLEILVSRPKLS